MGFLADKTVFSPLTKEIFKKLGTKVSQVNKYQLACL